MDIDFKSSISQWFIKPDGGFHKVAMNALCEQLRILINGRKFELSELYYPLGCLHYGKWIDNCYYLLLRVENNDMDSSLVSKSAGKKSINSENYDEMTVQAIADKIDFYFLECIAWD